MSVKFGMKARELTDSEIARLRSAWRDGVTALALSARFGVPSSKVLELCADWPRVRLPAKRCTPHISGGDL